VRGILFGDVHLDAVTAGVARRPEVLRFFASIEQAVVTEDADFVVFMGDCHDPGSMQESLYCSDLIDFAGALGRRATFLLIPGNHDVIECSVLTHEMWPLTTLSPVRTAFAQHQNNVLTVERPMFVEALVEGTDLGVLALPYTAKVHSGRVAGWLDDAFRDSEGWRERHPDQPFIVVGHMTVPGAVLGSESAEMARGGDRDFPFKRVAALRPSAVANGHYHRRQVVRSAGIDVVMPGSPMGFTFGEANDGGKGYLVVEV